MWCFVCLVILNLKGVISIGFSGQVSESLNLQQINNESSVLKKFLTEEDGFYQHSMNDDGSITATKEGIYILATNLILTVKSRNKVIIAFREKQLKEKILCKITQYLTDEETVSLSCFVRLKQLTQLELIISHQQVISVLYGSTISVQFIGTVGDTPSFIQPITEQVGTSGDVVYNPFKYYNSLRATGSVKNYTIPYSGVYAVSILANFNNTVDASIKLEVNDQTIFNTEYPDNGHVKSINIFRTFKFNENDVINLKMKNIDIHDGNFYSLVKLNDNSNYMRYSMPLNIEEKPKQVCSLVMKNNDQASSLFYGPIKGKSNDPFQTIKAGLYLISATIEVVTYSEHIKVTISGNSGMDDMEMSMMNSLSAKFRSPNKSKKIKVVGILHLYQNSKITLKLKPCEKIITFVNTSFISVVPVLQNTYTLLANIVDLNGVIITSKGKPIQLKGYLTESNHLFDSYVKNDKIIIPSNGAYLISVDVSMKSIGFSKQSINFSLVISNDSKNITRSHYNLKETTSQTIEMKMKVIVELYRGDFLTLFTKCDGSIQVTSPVSLKIVLLQKISHQSYQESMKKMDLTLTPGVVHSTLLNISVPIDGVYLITYKTLLEFQNLMGTNALKLIIFQDGSSKKYGLDDHLVLDEAEVGTTGKVTVETMGYLKLSMDTKIQIVLEDTNKNGLFIKILEYEFTFILSTNLLSNTIGFKNIQRSQRLFNFNNNLNALDNFVFDETVGGFKLQGTKFFGPYFVALRPMTVFYNVNVRLKDVKGVFKLCIRIRPSNKLIDISSPIIFETISSYTLSAFGFLTLAEEESIQLLVHGIDIRTIVLCTQSSWSLLEITAPNSPLYKHPTSELMSSYKDLPKNDIYALIDTYQSLSNQIKFINKMALPKIRAKNKDLFLFHTPKKQLVYGVENESTLNTSFLFSNTLINQTCLMTLISYEDTYNLKVDVSNGQNLLIENRSSDGYEENINVILCLGKSNKISIIPKKNGTDNIKADLRPVTVNPIITPENANSPVVRVVSLANIEDMEGFSSVISTTQQVMVEKNKAARLNGWISKEPLFYKRSNGYAAESGMFIVQESGFYFIVFKIYIANLDKSCSVKLLNDEATITSKRIRKDLVLYSSIIWFQRNSAIQIMIKCNSTQMVMLKEGSTYSVLLIESKPSFDHTDEFENQPQINIDKSTMVVSTRSDAFITCSLNSKFTGDFVWRKDDEILTTCTGKRECNLQLISASLEDAGKYFCSLKRGSVATTSNFLSIEVLEPRPKLTISSDIVYVEENFETNKFIAWVQVESLDGYTKTPSNVKLSLIEENADKNFYFLPEITKSISSLYFIRPFNYELKTIYLLQVEAKGLNSTDPNSIAYRNITVKIKNKDEFKPKFIEKTKICNIKENSPIDTSICRVKAIDKDKNSQVIYGMLKTIYANRISIGRFTGDIIVTGIIDYEISNIIDIVATATDGDYTAYQNVRLNIKDINDNRPEFENPVYEVVTSLFLLKKFPLIKVTATDRDSGINSKLSYSLLNGTNLFQINELDGEISTNAKLDKYEEYSYFINVEARDYGNPSLSSKCVVIVTVINTNVTSTEPKTHTIKKTLLERIRDGFMNWKYWLIGLGILIILVLIAITIILRKKYEKSQDKVEELLQRPEVDVEELRSLMLCTLKPTGSDEAILYISSETLPSPYVSSQSLQTTPLQIYESNINAAGNLLEQIKEKRIKDKLAYV